MTDKFIHVSGFTPTPYLKDLIDKHNQVVVINKTGSCGATVNIMKNFFYNGPLGIPFYSIEEIERKIKRNLLPEYLKRSLSEARL